MPTLLLQSPKFRRPELVSGPQKAFTLAEVLITLAIIGVVAALTIPTVVRNYREQQTVTQLKKVYSTLANAINMSIKDNGPISTWTIKENSTKESADDFTETYLAPYLKIQKKCGENATNDCYFGYNYLNNPTEYSIFYASRFYLQDGMFFAVVTFKNSSWQYASINVDINGRKKPNVRGKDIFNFFVFVKHPEPKFNGVFMMCGENNTIDEIKDPAKAWSCTSEGNGTTCGALIQKSGWQFPKNYSW